MNKHNTGLVIVTVLWMIILLGAIVAAICRTSRLDTKVCIAGTEGLHLAWACKAGIDTAVAVLNEDDKESDNLNDLWASNEEDFNDIELDTCIFNVRVIDEAGKLNINTATKKHLLDLPEMTEEIADAIIDWRDADDTPSTAGVEGGYYENLPYGYKIRNGPFRTVRELLMVKDVTPELLNGISTRWVDYLTCYSADNNKDAYGDNRININDADENKLAESLKIKKSYAKWIVENRPKKNGYKSIADLINNNSPKKAKENSKDTNKAEQIDLETFRQIADKITISKEDRIPGRVNINTASKTVLAALLGGGDSTEQIADNIIKYRDSLPGAMQSIAELLNVNSVNIGTFKKIANYVTTRSDIYTIHTFASSNQSRAGSAKFQIETVVDRSLKPARILYWYQRANN